MKHFEQRRTLLGAMAAAGLGGSAFLPSQASAQNAPTAWGWPQPYNRVSDKSIAWLKEKGWWPLGVGWQAPWSGQNTVMAVMDRQGLLNKRGIEENSHLLPLAQRLMKFLCLRKFKWALLGISHSTP